LIHHLKDEEEDDESDAHSLHEGSESEDASVGSEDQFEDDDEGDFMDDDE